jgi:hypothetical protein
LSCTVFRALGLHANIYPALERIEDDGDEGELVGTNLHEMVITEEGASDGYNDKKEVWRHYFFAISLDKADGHDDRSLRGFGSLHGVTTFIGLMTLGLKKRLWRI